MEELEAIQATEEAALAAEEAAAAAEDAVAAAMFGNDFLLGGDADDQGRKMRLIAMSNYAKTQFMYVDNGGFVNSGFDGDEMGGGLSRLNTAGTLTGTQTREVREIEGDGEGGDKARGGERRRWRRERGGG